MRWERHDMACDSAEADADTDGAMPAHVDPPRAIHLRHSHRAAAAAIVVCCEFVGDRPAEVFSIAGGDVGRGVGGVGNRSGFGGHV